jgi:integrase
MSTIFQKMLVGRVVGTVARPFHKLDPGWVKRTTEVGMHADGGGLYLQVSRFGTKSWIFRFMLDGRRREMGLGPYPAVSLAAAREKAADSRVMVQAEHADPIEVRIAQRNQARIDAAKAKTFRQCAEAYIAAHQSAWRNAKHRAQWSSTLATYVYPVFGSLPVQVIDVTLVLKVLEPIWTIKPETASRVRQRIESILDAAAARGYRQGENPARWRGHLDQVLAKKSKVARAVRQAKGKGEHFAAMPYADLPDFILELRNHTEISAKALEFTILTVKRTEEVIGAQRREVSARDKLWTIPAGRMKGEREHRVPLSDAVLALLDAVGAFDGDPDGFIFPGAKPGRGLSNMAMLNLLQERMDRPDVTVHGFRSTFRDWGAECTNFPNEVLEMHLAHVVNDKVEAAYRRGDLLEKRRELAEEWARYCGSAHHDKVVRLAASG